MGTEFAVVESNLVVAYNKMKIFALLTQSYPQDFTDFLFINFVKCSILGHLILA